MLLQFGATAEMKPGEYKAFRSLLFGALTIGGGFLLGFRV